MLISRCSRRPEAQCVNPLESALKVPSAALNVQLPPLSMYRGPLEKEKGMVIMRVTYRERGINYIPGKTRGISRDSSL